MQVLTGVVIKLDDGRLIEIKPHHVEVVCHLYQCSKRVAAIKFIRTEYDPMCLKDSKEFCDTVFARSSYSSGANYA